MTTTTINIASGTLATMTESYRFLGGDRINVVRDINAPGGPNPAVTQTIDDKTKECLERIAVTPWDEQEYDDYYRGIFRERE